MYKLYPLVTISFKTRNLQTRKFAPHNPTVYVGCQAEGEVTEKSDTAKPGEQGGLKQDKGRGSVGLKNCQQTGAGK